MDTARDAVAEGQATAVMIDYNLKPVWHEPCQRDPEVLDKFKFGILPLNEDSPVMSRAPLLLSESMLFPYREGLSFEQDIWMDKKGPRTARRARSPADIELGDSQPSRV